MFCLIINHQKKCFRLKSKIFARCRNYTDGSMALLLKFRFPKHYVLFNTRKEQPARIIAVNVSKEPHDNMLFFCIDSASLYGLRASISLSVLLLFLFFFQFFLVLVQCIFLNLSPVLINNIQMHLNFVCRGFDQAFMFMHPRARALVRKNIKHHHTDKANKLASPTECPSDRKCWWLLFFHCLCYIRFGSV